MALDDYYYHTVFKQAAAEAQANAARQQLIRDARTAAKLERATRREVRRLQDAVEGRRGLRQTLRGVFTDRFIRTDAQQATARPTDMSGGASSCDAATSDRQPSAGAH